MKKVAWMVVLRVETMVEMSVVEKVVHWVVK